MKTWCNCVNCREERVKILSARDARMREQVKEFFEEQENRADFFVKDGKDLVDKSYERGRFDAIHFLKREITEMLSEKALSLL